MDKYEMEEKEYVERELSRLLEKTLHLENELYSIKNFQWQIWKRKVLFYYLLIFNINMFVFVTKNLGGERESQKRDQHLGFPGGMAAGEMF